MFNIKMKVLKNIIALIFVTIGLHTNAQVPTVDAVLDTNVMLIGDQVGFKIRLQVPESTPFRWPVLGDTLPDKIEIVKKSAIDTTRLGDGFMNVEQTLTLTAFDTGYYVIKPLQFYYGDNNNYVETEPYLLNVFTVAVDTSLAIKPIKGPIAAPITFAEILPWAIAGVIALLIIGGLIYYFNQRKKNQPIVIKKARPKLPAHRIALDDLDKLREEKLWQRGQVKAYHSRLTDILRIYVEDRFKIAALEMTTWETIRAFAGAKIEKSNLEKLREMLELADLVKFAKLKPLPGENEKSMADAIQFVKQTTIEPNGSNANTNTDISNPKPELAGTDVKSL